MRIYDREVGPGHPTFIVAEGGSNHGGSLKTALALTDEAAEAQANAVKWQLWLSPDEMYDREQFPTEWASADKYRLPVEWLPALCDKAHSRGMAFGLSSFGFASLDEADKWVDFHKVASIEGQWHAFVDAVIAKNKPVIISIGMLDRIRYRKEELIYLGCTVSYPCATEDAAVRSMPTWNGLYGYSDHTTHPTIAPCAAVALGACVIEKHLRANTFESANPTPDEAHSLSPSQFKEMVSAVRLTEQALGSSEKRIRKSEEPYLKYRRGPRGLRGS